IVLQGVQNAPCGKWGIFIVDSADRGNIGGALDLFDRESLDWDSNHRLPLEETKRLNPYLDESPLGTRNGWSMSISASFEGGDRLGGDGIGVATVGDFLNLKVPIFQPPNTESLNFELYKVGCKLSMHEAITCGPVMLIEQLNENMAMHMRVVKNLNCDVPQANNLRKSNSNGSIMNTVGKVKLFMEVMMIIMKGNHVDVPFDPGENHVPSCQPFDDLEGEVTSSSLTWPLPQAATLRLA
ncbi:hypothetical protein Tco_1468511, partial [Tanacetum coccineum]